ncbi:cytosine permease [Streptomyces sp. NBC_01537]|uniref:purine-cytosine permease family protein n=1 Tax=Streptomyces sp. NBC_01537 TaxID=2903896 RepID=UPI00386C7A9B
MPALESAEGAVPDQSSRLKSLGVELNALNTIAEEERTQKPRSLFWPWFGSNVSVLGLSYGSYLLAFGISLWQATIVGLIGVVFSFLLCGVVSIAGKRGSAPTMVLSRAPFGVHGNRAPSALSWLLAVGWETVLASLAVLATATVFTQLGWDGGVGTKILALAAVVVLVLAGGIAGFDVIMKMQKWITIVTGVLTVVYIVLVSDRIDFTAVSNLPAGSPQGLMGGCVFVMTGFGLGWVISAADFSRYLPRNTPSSRVTGWTTFGGSLAPAVLLIFGILLAGSSPKLNTAIGLDPIGALATLLPTWFLVPFAIVTVLGLVGGAVLGIYSSGLALMSAGIPVPRYVAAGVDGVLMTAGAIYVAFFATSFIGPFQGFLITLGVPVAAWCGIFLADLLLRREDYVERDLYDPRGRYGGTPALPLLILGLSTVVGWGLVTNTFAGWLTWQGFLLEPLGLGGRGGAWAYANLGVLVALVLGFAGTLALSRAAVRRQESPPAPAEAPEAILGTVQ